MALGSRQAWQLARRYERTISPSMQSCGVLPNPPEHVVMPITTMATSAARTDCTAAVKPERTVLLMSTPSW